MDKKSKWNTKSNFLDSIPSQLRYAYLALKKKQDAKPSQLRDGDKDLEEVISGHNFGYLSFEKICKNEFQPEDCFLQFDAVSCELLLESPTSKEVSVFQLFELCRPTPQFVTVNKRTRNIDMALVLCLNVMAIDATGCKIVVPMHFISENSDVVATWRHALKTALADSATSAGMEASEWGASFLWRVWRTVPAPDVTLYDHLFQDVPDATSEVPDLEVPSQDEFGPEKNMDPLSMLLPILGSCSAEPADGSPTSKVFDKVLYRDSRDKCESLSYFELLSSQSPKEVRRLHMLKQAGVVSDIHLNVTMACAAELWDDAYGMAINPRFMPFDGIRADGNTALHFVCNQDPKSAKSSLGNGSIYEKLLRVLLEKGGEQMVNAENRQGVTPLMIAVAWSNLVLVQLLVSLSADVSAEDVMGNTCFHYAVAHSDPAVLELLVLKMSKLRRLSFIQQLPKASNHTKSQFAKIRAAVSLRRMPVSNQNSNQEQEQPSDLTSYAQIICMPNSSGYSCLHLAIARNDTDKLCRFLEFLCDLGLHARLLCAPDHRGETPLHFACRKGSVEDIMVLLLFGSRVGAMTDNGSTCESLLRKFLFRKPRGSGTLQFLEMMGQVTLKEDHDYENFMEQKHSKDASPSIVTIQVEFCQILRKKRKFGFGMPSVFHMLSLMPSLKVYCPTLASSCDWVMQLVEEGDVEKFIHELDEMGENVASCLDMTDSKGNSLLHKAVQFNNFGAVLMLLDAGADATKENASGVTAVHIAASNGLPDTFFSIVSSLLHFEFLFRSGTTIMHLAASGGSLDILNALHSFGGSLEDDVGDKNGILEAAIQHEQLKTSLYVACRLPIPSWTQSIILEITEFVDKLENCVSNWCILIDASAPSGVNNEIHSTITNANGLMVAQSLSSNDDSALWRHVSDEVWQSLAQWQSRDEHRYYLVHIAVINRQYRALYTMLVNGHSPSVVDGKFCTPILYASLQGDWRLVVVLRSLYLAPFWTEEGQGSDFFDDTLVLESIRNDDKHVLVALLLLNAPLASNIQEIVIESERIHSEMFPSSLIKAFELKNQQIFRFLIQGCFCHSIINNEGSFEKIVMNLKSAFVCSAQSESVLDTPSILHRLVETVTVLKKHQVPATCTESQGNFEQDKTGVRNTSKVPQLTSSLKSSIDAAQDAPCDITLKSELEFVETQSLTTKESVGLTDDVNSHLDVPVHSYSILSSTCDSQFCSDESVFQACNTPNTGSEYDDPVMQSTVSDAVAVPSYCATIASGPTQEVSCEGAPEDSNQNQMNLSLARDDEITVTGLVHSPTHSSVSLSSPVHSAENGHYAVKESVTLAFDAFELDIDPEYRNIEAAVKFEVQDVLPVLQVEDRIGNSFLNACKLGLDEVLICLVNSFSVDSIFNCSQVAGGNPLHLAVSSRSLSTVEILLKWRPSLILEVDKDGRTPLHAACGLNFHAALSKILNSASNAAGKAHRVDLEGDSCLTLAVKQGACECVELLALNENDALIAPSKKVPCALELSLTSSLYNSRTFLRLFNLCSEHAVHSFRSSHDNGLLHVAVKYQRIHSICAILQRMGEGFAQVRDSTGRTAVEIAASSSNKSMFNILVHQTQELESAANHCVPDAITLVHSNQTYFGEADTTKPYGLRCFPGGNRVSSSLIDQIYSCVMGDSKGSGMLHLFQKVVASGNSHILGMPIFKLGPQNKCTCLHLAAGVNSVASLQFVLDHCSRCRHFIDLHNSDGLTACAVALIAGNTKCVKLLLQQGSRIVTENQCETEHSMRRTTCNLLHICAKHCHDSSIMEQLIDFSSLSNIISLDDSNQSLLHICAHVNNIHAYSAIASKAPHAVFILINHRDDLGNTALHVCSSNSASLNMAHALMQSGCYTHMRNYDADLPYDIAVFMGNIDIAQVTRVFKSEECVKSNFRSRCDDYVEDLVKVISHDKASEISQMCKSPLWIGSWLRVDFMSSATCAQKAFSLKMATALSDAGFCAMSSPKLVEHLLGMMLKNENATIVRSLEMMFANCSNLAVSLFLMHQFPTFLLQVASEKNLDDSIFCWVVKNWTRPSVCDQNGSNALQLACQTENAKFLNAVICHLEETSLRAEPSLCDQEVLLSYKTEIMKSILSRNAAGHSFIHMTSGTSVANQAEKILSLVACKSFLRMDAIPADSVLNVLPQHHLTLVSLGMIESLFQEADFDVELTKLSRDRHGRCLLANACISGQVACVSSLLEKGLSPSLVDCEGRGILHHAVLNHKNDIIYFIIQRFPQKIFELDSTGRCLLHQAIRNGSDEQSLSTLKELQKNIDKSSFLQLCLMSDHSKRTAVEEALLTEKYDSGMFMLQIVMLYCGSFSANPIHVFEVFVMDYINKTFQVVSEFNVFMTKICTAASAQNSLMSFLNVFCSEPQHPLEHDDVLQPQNIESAKSSVKVLNSDLKSSSFCSGQWVCLEETFSEHFLVSNDTSSTKASLVQIFSSIYDHPAFSNCVRPSVSESLMAHSFRLNWILQDGVSPVDCERMLDIHSELIRHFLVLERLSLVFYSKIQTNCRDQFLKLTSSEGLHKTRLDQVSESTLQDGTVPAFDSQKLNAIGIYPPIASNSPDATELFALVTANNFEGIMSCIRKSTKHLTLSLDSHKNTLGHAVAFFCSLDVVEKLIDVGLHVDLRNDSGQMPFHFACLSGRFEVARVLFRKMKSTDLPLDSYGHSLLHFAALSMNENCVSSVQTTCHIAWDSTTSRRQTALDLVLDMEVNPKHSVCILLTKGEALAEACNSKLVSIQNALQSSLITSCRLDLQSKAACCVNAGADIRVYFPVQADDGGHNIWNAIDVCAAYNSASVMKSIFDCVTNDVWLEAVQHSIRNRQRNQLPSSLWVACKHMSLNSLKFLLENGSNLMEEDDSGLNIFAFCIKLRCDDSLSQLLHFCSANYADVFLRKFVLAPDKMGLSCIEHAIQERHPHAICILREFLLGAKLCDETEMIVLGQKYLKLLCYSRYDVPRNPCSTFQCIIEVIKFFHTDFAQALMLSYRNNNRPLESCRDVGRHDSAVLLFTLHLLAQVNFDGKLILDAGSDRKFDSSFIVLQSGSSTIWNALQLIERILHAFTGRDSLILRYLSAQVEKFIAKLDDDCINSFSKLVLLSMNEPKSQDINAWEHFYRRVSKAFDEELSAHDAARHAPYSMMNFTTQQNELLDAIYRGDSSALNNHILKNPSVYLDPTQSRDFHNQCYMAAVHGDQEHILEFLVQKGFQYSQISGDENLLMLASRLGRSTIIRGLSRRPCLDLDVNYSIADGACALHLACARNFSDTLRSLVSNFPSINVNALNAVGESAVSLCVKYSHISVLETMIENLGIPEFLSVLNASGQNFFHEAASADNPVILQAAVAIMLKMLNQTHVFGGKTPSCDLLKSLVETTESVSQPDVSHVLVAALLARDVNGDTPAHVCIRCRSVASLAILIRMCPVACVVPNVSGSSPLHVAVSRSLFSIDLFRLLISAAKSLGPWIFDDESMQQLVEEHCVAHASVMAALCHFEDAGGSTVWDIAFAENADAKSLITKFINLCRQNNPQKPHIPRLIESSILKTLFLKAAALPSQNKRKSKGLGSIYLGSIDFLQNILHRCKLNRWYIKQLEKRNYEAGRCLLSSLLLQRSWRRHVASKNMTAAKFLKTCYIRIQSSIRNLLSRRVYMFRKNLHEQLARVEQSGLLWNAYERFSKRKFALTNFQASTRLNFEYRNRCSISGAVQLQAAIMSHHLYLLRKHYAKKNAHFMKITAAATLQRVFRGREGRRLFSVLRQMSEQDQCVILPTGRKLRVHKYSLLRLIRRAQCAVRYLLAKRQLSVQYFSKNGLKSCCLIQRAWTNHFCRVQVRRARANIENLKLSALASRIQKCFRSKLSRIHFKTSVEKFRCFQAAVALQCALRCRFALQLFRLRADGAVLQAQKLRQVQDVRVFIENESLKIKRERVERHLATLKNKAATVISSLIRGVIVRSRMVYSIKEPKCLFQNNSSSAEKIQQVWLRHCALRKMRSLGWSFGKKAKQTVSAKRIVSYIKTRLAQKVVSIARKLRAVIILQKMWRVNRSNAACHKIRSDLWDLRLESKATKIQAVTKAHWVRKSFVTLKSSWPQLRELRISKKVMQQLFTNFQKSKFHKIVLQALMKHKNECIQKIQCAFRSKIARNTCRCSVSLHNMSIIVTKVQKLQKFWRRCSEEKRFCSKLPWMLFPWPSADVRLEASSWSVVHAYDVRLEGFMQSKQFDDYEKSLSAACQFGMRQLQEVPDDAAYALQSLVRFAASMCETALYHGNKKIAFSLASRAVKLMGTEKNKFVLNCTTEFSAWVLDTLAHVLFSRGLFSHALSLINEAIVAGGLRSSPDSNMLAILHFHKGLVYQNLGNVSSAKDNFSRACQLFHNNVDNSYSLHFAASYLALSRMMSLSGNYDGAALNCSVARGILSKVPMNSVHETFFPPSMCWRFAGLLQVLRRFATSSDRFIQSALLKIARSRIPINERVQKSRARRFFNRPHLFPKGFESWTRWSCRSFGAYGIIPEKPNEVMVQKFQKSRKIDVDHALSTVAAPDSGYFREYLPFEENTAHLPSVQHEGSIEDKLKGRFRQMHSAPVLIHPWHIFNESGLTQNAFQDFQFILSSCLDVSATPTSQQRWLKLLECHAPDGHLPSFVKDLVTHAPSADSKCHDSVDLTSVKSFSASPNPMPRKDIVSCLNRVMLSLLQRACLLWHLAADGQGNTTECKDCVQLLKDMLDNNMNSLKRAISKTWKYVIVLCDAVLFALSENYSEAFNLCMRVHDGLQKSEQLQHLEFTVLGLASCNAVYCLWHFQKMDEANISSSTTVALVDMLSADVKLAVRMGLATHAFVFCLFHNLGHISVESGEYLRAFRAWGEAHKTLETASQRDNQSISEIVESFTSNVKGVLKSSKVSIENAISTWLSIKELVSSAEYRVSTGIQGIRNIKQTHQKTPKKQKEDVIDTEDSTPNQSIVSLNIVQQTLPEELFSGLFGSGANRVRAAAPRKCGPTNV